MFRTIGPVWDGNEVWLVVAGGATFAAFPAWYATMFSGFYLALLLVLVFLIVRVVSFEWREQSTRARAGARVWTWANTIGSVGASLDLGRRALEPAPRRAAQLRAATSPATSPTCSAPTPCSAGSRSCCCSPSTARRTSRCARPASCASARPRPRGGCRSPRARRRRRLPGLDGRRRGRPQRQGPLPAAPARGARDRGARSALSLRHGAPQRLGVRADRGRDGRSSSRRSSPACIRA